jgi:hypothetical protein
VGKVLVKSNDLVGDEEDNADESDDASGNLKDDVVLHKRVFSGFGIIVLH